MKICFRHESMIMRDSRGRVIDVAVRSGERVEMFCCRGWCLTSDCNCRFYDGLVIGIGFGFAPAPPLHDGCDCVSEDIRQCSN